MFVAGGIMAVRCDRQVEGDVIESARTRSRPEPDFRSLDWFARERPLEHDPLTPLVDVLQALQR